MRNLVCECGTSLWNKALFRQTGKVQNQKFKLLHYHVHRIESKADFSYQNLAVTVRCKNQTTLSNLESSFDDYHCLNKTENVGKVHLGTPEKNFWGAVALIVGTAVGPGMLGLPSVTIKSGPLPSTLALILSWLYVISSIILVAELSFAVMEEDSVSEVSFTGLARKTIGNSFGSFAALVYASLSFSLLVACVSGIGSIVSQCFPWLRPGIACGLFPSIVGVILWLLPFKAIDLVNRFLCIMMIFSIIVLVGVGLLVGRTNIFGSFGYASWEIATILPAIPVAVLTLGFHVITPFVCKLAGNTVKEVRKAILFGGVIPLVMVLLWNLIVIGLAGTKKSASTQDPILLLLSVNSHALPAVRGFAFSALATSLIGYVVSLPKQIVDTLELSFGQSNFQQKQSQETKDFSCGNEPGKIGLITYTYQQGFGKAGKVCYGCLPFHSTSEAISSASAPNSFRSMVLALILVIPVLLASLSSSTFSRSLDYAGIYANCFLFGILPPLMMHNYQREKKVRLTAIPGGNVALLIIFGISVVLAIWH